MKLFIGLLILTFASVITTQAFAKPLPFPEGTYHYSDFKVALQKRYEVVYGFSTSGQERLKELLRQNNTCENTGRQIYLCSVFMSATGKAEIQQKVTQLLTNRLLKVHKSSGEPQLISEGDALKEYQIDQAVEFNGNTFDNYRYLITADQEKIFLGDPAVETFLLNPQGEIAYSLPLILEESKTVYFMYLVLAEYIP